MAKTNNPIGNEDFDYVRCTRCNFPCLLTRDKINPGNGMVYTDSATGPDEFTSTFGCPQCGRGDYTDSKFFR